ncbi:hypothetical protein [Conservatibacter flavescens]|uniref:Glutaredoxin n=1 Tax=Conservatibacter flavescens TaxID=28161 RepID=A0A2M8S385_9PAST|nr:hypothetical protein [Conservatibacter flavescens]PJG85609.1 hypothetical protein CVP05_05450 [Conservatibacter flavescens]
MTTPILYFSDKCPDTAPFVAKLKALQIDYLEANISENMPNLKAFLALRDNHSAFAERKAKGYIGIPALVYEDGRIVFDVGELK